MESWLGAGAGASGTIVDEKNGVARRSVGSRLRVSDMTGVRNTGAGHACAENDLYTYAEEIISRKELIEETFLMGFRSLEGPDCSLFKSRFGFSIGDCIPKTLAKWRERGLAASADGACALTKEGIVFLDRFLVEAFTELDAAENPLFSLHLRGYTGTGRNQGD
jgi:oxygen-independent coproporphyrinogen-3 oxidase